MTLRFQFLDGSVHDGSWVRSLGPFVFVTYVIVSFVFPFGALFGDKNRFTFIGLLVLTCAICHTFPCQSFVRTKMDPIGNKPFWLYGLSMSIKHAYRHLSIPNNRDKLFEYALHGGSRHKSILFSTNTALSLIGSIMS